MTSTEEHSTQEMVAVLQKREEERVADVLKRRNEREKTNVAEESYAFFHKTFKNKLSETMTKLDDSKNLDPEKISKHFDEIASDISELQNSVSKAAVFLTQFDVRISHNELTAIQNKLKDFRKRFMPTKKFVFGNKKKKSDTKTKSAVITSDSKSVGNGNKQESDLSVDLANCKFTDISEQELIKTRDEINNKDVALVNLKQCVVKLFGSPSVLHINGLTDCQIYCGPVCGSIFIRECTNCTFVVACQQLRIHTTTNSRFHMHVTSRAIIEDCAGIKVGKYNWIYTDLDEHYERSGLDRAINNWNLVDDFNWLSSDKQSPNWTILSENE